MPYFTLNNGHKVPAIGTGTFTGMVYKIPVFFLSFFSFPKLRPEIFAKFLQTLQLPELIFALMAHVLYIFHADVRNHDGSYFQRHTGNFKGRAWNHVRDDKDVAADGRAWH